MTRIFVVDDSPFIRKAILRAAESIGGFQQDLVPGVNDTIFNAYGTDDKIAEFLADRPEYRLVPMGEVWRQALGQPCPVPGDTLRMDMKILKKKATAVKAQGVATVDGVVVAGPVARLREPATDYGRRSSIGHLLTFPLRRSLPPTLPPWRSTLRGGVEETASVSSIHPLRLTSRRPDPRFCRSAPLTAVARSPPTERRWPGSRSTRGFRT